MENWNSIMDESNILNNVKKEPLQEIEIKTEYLENQYEETAETQIEGRVNPKENNQESKKDEEIGKDEKQIIEESHKEGSAY